MPAGAKLLHNWLHSKGASKPPGRVCVKDMRVIQPAWLDLWLRTYGPVYKHVCLWPL